MPIEPVKAVVFAVDASGDSESVELALEELTQLADSAGARIVGQLVQRRLAPDPATYLGPGKTDELRLEAIGAGAELVICDDELTPVQAAKLADSVGVRVIDRTQLILDIFASRAQSREGKVQVELAQLRYLLPRLVGTGVEMSRLGGGIGTRGPGETKLETDRRHVRRRIAQLRRELTRIQQRRQAQRVTRQESQMPLVALVGYTNAGKSTLLNRLTGAQVLAEDRLFATLDPTIRGVELPQGDKALLVDTVGFIRKLPHELVAAFRATLEEVTSADLLVHVVDVSHPQMREQIEAVHAVLEDLGVADMPLVTAFNKSDLLEEATARPLVLRTSHSCLVSAVTGEGCDGLLQLVGENLPEHRTLRTYRVPYEESRVVSWLHESARVVEEHFEIDAVVVHAEVRQSLAERIRQFEVTGST